MTYLTCGSSSLSLHFYYHQHVAFMYSFQFCPLCKGDLIPGNLGYPVCSNSACGFVHYDNPTPVVAAIVEYGGENVILAHNKLWPPTWYGLITGFVEKNEVPHETVIREVKEELGLDGELVAFIGHYAFKRMNQLIMAYHIRAEGKITLNDELDDYKVVPFEKARYWPAGTGYALRDFLVAKGYDPVEVPFS